MSSRGPGVPKLVATEVNSVPCPFPSLCQSVNTPPRVNLGFGSVGFLATLLTVGTQTALFGSFSDKDFTKASWPWTLVKTRA